MPSTNAEISPLQNEQQNDTLRRVYLVPTKQLKVSLAVFFILFCWCLCLAALGIVVGLALCAALCFGFGAAYLFYHGYYSSISFTKEYLTCRTLLWKVESYAWQDFDYYNNVGDAKNTVELFFETDRLLKIAVKFFEKNAAFWRCVHMRVFSLQESEGDYAMYQWGGVLEGQDVRLLCLGLSEELEWRMHYQRIVRLLKIDPVQMHFETQKGKRFSLPTNLYSIIEPQSKVQDAQVYDVVVTGHVDDFLAIGLDDLEVNRHIPHSQNLEHIERPRS